MPYRISAPPQPEAIEVEEPYAAVLRAQRRRARLLSALIVIFVAGGLAKVAHSGQQPPRRPITEATRRGNDARARVAIASALARATAEQARFEAGVREAIAEGVGPRPDLGACPIALSARHLAQHGASASLVHRRAAFPLLIIDRAEPAGGVEDTMPSQAIAGVLADVRRAEAHLAAGRFVEATLYARALDRPERFGYEVVLLARANKPVRALSGSAFEPGEIEGRAYVFDFASGRVVCAGDVTARSSREIGYVYSDRSDTPSWLGPVPSLGDAIREDIRRQTERAIIEAVRFRSGPL